MATKQTKPTASAIPPASADVGGAKPKTGRPQKPKEISADTTEQVSEQIIQTKQTRNRPDLQNFGAENVKPGDNSRFLRYAMAWLDLPPIDISDPAQVEQRIYDYFTFCIKNDRKPNIKGMGNWLGVSRDTVNTWKTGEYRAETHSALIKKAIDLLEELWVDYMMNGKVNPASGIFLGKNMFGYKDEQTYNITPLSPLGSDSDPTTINKKYQHALPGASDSGDSEKD